MTAPVIAFEDLTPTTSLRAACIKGVFDKILDPFQVDGEDVQDIVVREAFLEGRSLVLRFYGGLAANSERLRSGDIISVVGGKVQVENNAEPTAEDIRVAVMPVNSPTVKIQRGEAVFEIDMDVLDVPEDFGEEGAAEDKDTGRFFPDKSWKRVKRPKLDYQYLTVAEAQKLDRGEIFHIIGLVTYLRELRQTATGEWMLQMSIKDETVGPYTDGLRCLIFQKLRVDMPEVRMGDVVRIHRATIDIHNGNHQLQKSKRYFRMAVIEAAPGGTEVAQIRGDPTGHSPLSEVDIQRFTELRSLDTTGSLSTSEPAAAASAVPMMRVNRSSQPWLKELRHGMVADIICQVVELPVTFNPAWSAYNIRIWDGTVPPAAPGRPAPAPEPADPWLRTASAVLFDHHKMLAEKLQVGDWVRLPSASVNYSSAPDGAGYWRINMRGGNSKLGEKLALDHPEVIKRIRLLEDARLGFPKRAPLVDTDDTDRHPQQPQPVRKMLAKTKNQAFPPDSIKDILLEQGNRKFRCRAQVADVSPSAASLFAQRSCDTCKTMTPLVDITEDKDDRRCTSCGGQSEDVFALSLTLKDDTGTLKAILYGPDAREFMKGLCPGDVSGSQALQQELQERIAKLKDITAWIDCSLMSYTNTSDKENPQRYRIFDTSLLDVPDDALDFSQV